MMDPETGKDFTSLLHAFAIGCLERDDYDLMMEYFKSNQDYPWQELGEYQNLVALLPSFLDIEVPDARVKDMVARKLYRLRDQQRPQRNTQIISRTSPGEHKNLFQRIETPEQKLFSQISAPSLENEINEQEQGSETLESPNTNIHRTEEFEPVSSEQNAYLYNPEKETFNPNDFSSQVSPDENEVLEDTKTGYSSDVTEDNGANYLSNFDQIESESKEPSEDKDEFSFESSLSNYSFNADSLPKTDETVSSFTSETMIEEPTVDTHQQPLVVGKVKSGVSPFVFVLTFFVLAGTIGAVYYFLSKDFKLATEKQTAKYEEMVQSLQRDLSTTTEVDALLASINLQIVTLKSTPKATGAYGKLLFDAVTRKAMLQVVNLPVLSSDKVYQLWIISNNQKYSAGIYSPTSSKQYFPVTNFGELNLIGSTSFLITEEIATGGEKPSKDVYLIGQFVL